MKLPHMKYSDGISKKTQLKFGGLNMSRGAGDGELAAMENMTGDYFPLLASRRPRRLLMQLQQSGAIFSHNGLGWIAGGWLYVDGIARVEVSPGLKQVVFVGPYIFVFPDKIYYHTVSGAHGSMEASWEGEKLTFMDGVIYGEEAKANTVQAEGVDWAAYFKPGDAVTISGCTEEPGNNKVPIIREIDGDKLIFSEYCFTIPEDRPCIETGTLRICRTIPELKFVFEHENRLWGCTADTIYSSKWDDPFNFSVYDGIASDSWTITPLSKGPFTGGVGYKGYPIFFKEDRIYKIYGSVGTDFQSIDSASLGLSDGSGGSLAIAGEMLFYLNDRGVMAYGGGIPQPMHEAFGDHRYRNAVAGSDGLNYYVSMEDDAGWSLFVFNTQNGLWHRQDGLHVTHFATISGVLHMLDDQGCVWTVDGEEGAMEDQVEWFAEFADFTEDDPNKKGFSKAQIRLELGEGAEAQCHVMFDSDGVWLPVGPRMVGNEKRSYYLPVIPRRCDHYRLKITGIGEVYIHSITRETYSGSELRRH